MNNTQLTNNSHIVLFVDVVSNDSYLHHSVRHPKHCFACSTVPVIINQSTFQTVNRKRYQDLSSHTLYSVQYCNTTICLVHNFSKNPNPNSGCDYCFCCFFRERSIYFEPNALYTPVEKLAESEKGEETIGNNILAHTRVPDPDPIFLGLLDPDPLVSGTGPAPDPFIIKQ
jgi:hypothetical protein